MRPSGHWTATDTDGNRGRREHTRGYKLGFMFLVLLGAYLLMSRLPLESIEGGHGVDLSFVLFWVVGGGVTLALLLVAGRKRGRKV